MAAEKNTLPPLYASHPDAYQTAQNPLTPQPQPYYPNPYQIPATPLGSVHQAPAQVDCPACMYRVMTRVDPVSGNTTHAWAASLCFCCCLGCLPYLSSSLKDIDHYCGRCGVLLATWHNSGRVEVRHKPAMIQRPQPDIKPPPRPQPQPATAPQLQSHPQPQPPPPAMTITQMPTPIPSPPPQVLTPEQEIEMKMELPPPRPDPKTQEAPIEMDASVEVQHTPAPSPVPDSSVSVSDSGIGAGRKPSEISGIHENQDLSQRGL